jgi:transposase
VPRRSPYSVAARVALLLRDHTQKEIAKRLGVSERTIRRWKNEEKRSPRARAAVRPSVTVERLLTRESNRERRRIVSHDERLARGRQPVPKQLDVTPIGERRALRNYRQGKWDGTYRESAWINYDVSGLKMNTMLAMLRTYIGEDLSVQFIFRAALDEPGISGRVIKDASGRPAYMRAASAPEYMGDIEDESQLADMLDENFNRPGRRAMYIAVHDRGRPPVIKNPRKRKRK